jgi:hypothetical protein
MISRQRECRGTQNNHHHGGADMTTTTSELMAFDRTRPSEAWVAAAGFLARYSGTTRASYASDLKCFFGFCAAHDLDPLEVTRVQVELWARTMVVQRVALVISARPTGWLHEDGQRSDLAIVVSVTGSCQSVAL